MLTEGFVRRLRAGQTASPLTSILTSTHYTETAALNQYCLYNRYGSSLYPLLIPFYWLLGSLMLDFNHLEKQKADVCKTSEGVLHVVVVISVEVLGLVQ